MIKRSDKTEIRKKAKTAAMSCVKKLVAKHSRIIIQSCLNTIREHEKKAEKLKSLKSEVKKLEKEL